MAVYGRNREKWDPTKVKSKVSKNNTYELKTTTVTNITPEVFDLKNTMWTHLAWDDGIKWTNAKRVSGTSAHAYPLKGYENPEYIISPTSWTPDFIKIKTSRFGHAINFGIPPAAADQSEHYYLREPQYGHYGLSQLFGDEWQYTEDGQHTIVTESRYLYFSFWIYLHDQNSPTGGDGHTFAQLAYTSEDDDDEPWDLDPAISFYINSSGVVAMRFTERVGPGNDLHPTGAPGENYIDYSDGGSNCMFVEIASDSNRISTKQWHYVTFALKFDAGWDATTATSEAMIFIDGKKTTVATPIVLNSSLDFSSANQYDENTIWEWQFGSLINSYGAYNHDANAGTDIVKRSSGFSGALGEFTIISQDHYDTDATIETNNRTNFAKFLWEAQREGAYHLHSGVHSSSPRLEQLDLDRDSLYPSNFTLRNYTQGGWEADQSRVSKRSRSRFTEGYNILDGEYVWQENASQYFVNSNKVMPHIRLNPADTILTNGNWYSDARSEFFSEDLDETTGFVVTDQASDELYREHYTTDTAQKYVEIDIPEDYKDCFVIDIPVPNTSALLLGTDRQSVHSSAAEESRITSHGHVNISPDGRVANMAYYNFSSSQWETLDIGPASSDRDYGMYAATPTDTNFIDQSDIGFSPMSGLIVPSSEEEASKILPLHGHPTSDYGFPFSYQFVPSSDQEINLSKYIDAPVILAGWEIKTKVIPVVGYPTYTTTNQDASFGYSVGDGKSPFHYGGHGEAAVYFNHRKHLTAFNKNIIIDSPDQWHVGNTVPVTKVSGTSEIQPTKDTPGLVTSGITAFLLRKEKLTDTNELRDNYHQLAKPNKYISKFTNLSTSDLSLLHGAYWSNMANLSIDHNETHQYGAGASFYPLWSDPTTSAWSTAKNTQVLGWLQHVYHNDQHVTSYDTRKYWTREDDVENAYRATAGKNIISMLGKENASYVQDLLYTNTTEVDMHVLGPPKQASKIVDGIPVTNFFIAPKSQLLNDVLLASNGTQPSHVTFTTGAGYGTPQIYEGNTLWEDAQIMADIIPGCGIPDPATAANEASWTFVSSNSSGDPNLEIQIDISSTISSRSTWTGMEMYFQFKFNGTWDDTNLFGVKFYDINGALMTLRIVGWHKTTNPYSVWSDSGGTMNGSFIIAPAKTGGAVSDGNMSSGTFHWLKVVLDDTSDNISDIASIRMGVSGLESNEYETLSIANLSIGGIESGTDNLGSYKSSADDSIKYAISTASESTLNLGDSGLGEHSIIPRYAPYNVSGTTIIPKINVPTDLVVATDSIDTFHKTIKMSDSVDESSSVVLNPTDSLVLGIQNSISTAMASQQINKACDQFIRWGRTSLTIPVQNNATSSPYLRLYVKKTRQDEDFNIIADSSNYNANVNRDLGDHANADQFLLANTALYSGSIADDIIGPTYFTPATSVINVPSSLATSPDEIAFPPGYSDFVKMMRLFSDTMNMEENDPWMSTRPHWRKVLEHLKGSPPAGSERSFNYLFETYTESEINAAIQAGGMCSDKEGDHSYDQSACTTAGHDWTSFSSKTLDNLGLPVDPQTFRWTALNHTVFEYGGPIPAKTNDYISFRAFLPEITQGFLTTDDEFRNPGDPDVILFTDPEVDGGAWPMRQSSAWFIEELNPNPNPPMPQYNGNDLLTTDRRRPYSHCGAVSAWYTKFKLPFYSNSVPGGIISALSLEFRTVKIDSNRPPTYTDGTTVAIGDAFIFNDSHEIIKIQAGITGNADILNQRFKEGQIIFIVGGGGVPTMVTVGDAMDYNTSVDDTQSFRCWVLGTGSPTAWNGSSTTVGFLTWTQLWNKIESILEIQLTYNSALLYSVIGADSDNLFSLKFKTDIRLQHEFRLNQNNVNDAMGFYLCGVDLSEGDISDSSFPLDVFPNGEEIMFAQGEGLAPGVFWDGDPQFSHDEIDTQTDSWVKWIELGGKLYDDNGNAVAYEATSNLVGNFVSHFLEAYQMGMYFCGDLSSPHADRGQIKIDYDFLPSKAPQYSSAAEGYTEAVHRRIDRKVSFRNSERINTVYDAIQDDTKIGKAGTFGGLKKNSVVVDEKSLFWDGMLPHATSFSESVDLTSYTPFVYSSDKKGMGWILETVVKKNQEQFSNISFQIQATMTQTAPALYDASNSEAFDYIYEVDEDTVISFPLATAEHNKLNVTNYFQRDFRGTRDYTAVTLKNLMYCFGNGISGRMVIRPSLMPWPSYEADTKVLADGNTWSNELVLDPPRGFRFGLLGYNENPKYVFSQKHYGHVRDMFEQSLDTKRSNFQSDVKTFGSPVVVSSINIVNPEIPKRMEHTSRYNKTINATVVKPYIEDNYEATVNPTNLNSESLRVDVAGSIRTRGITAPGGIAGNIRTRG